METKQKSLKTTVLLKRGAIWVSMLVWGSLPSLGPRFPIYLGDGGTLQRPSNAIANDPNTPMENMASIYEFAMFFSFSLSVTGNHSVV